MRKLFLLLFVSTLTFGQDKTSASPWQPLQKLVGQWQGVSAGDPGEGRTERQYEFLYDGKFLQVNSTSTYPPQEKNKKGEVHHEIELFSYDKQRKKIILRQFTSEGFVNQYVQESADANKIVFVTESIENITPGWRGRESYTIVSKDEMTERFELAAPGKDFELYLEIRLTRKK